MIPANAPHTISGLCGFVLAGSITLDAQWLKLPTPGLPRLADGKPNFAAPAPRTPDGKPDFSGLWKNDGGDRYGHPVDLCRDLRHRQQRLEAFRARDGRRVEPVFDYDGKGKELLIPLSRLAPEVRSVCRGGFAFIFAKTADPTGSAPRS